jgi:hypothetical protein
LIDDRVFSHLTAMSDARGLFEHANGLLPRLEHGYCTDDNARLLTLTSLHDDLGAPHALSRMSLRFVREAQMPDGRTRNRMDTDGRWTDQPTTEDCWGRGLAGLGNAAAHHDNPTIRKWALRGFERGARRRSDWPRAMAFAAIGAAEVATVASTHHEARALLRAAVETIGPLPSSGTWCWPEPRLRYANATLAEALIAAGAALGDRRAQQQGLDMLQWLLELEMTPGHLSVVGHGGRGPDDEGPQFDQQPIEVAAMADACWRALRMTDDPDWARGIAAADAWFRGKNDAGLTMFDDASQGGYDGLHADRVNRNQGAESTLAYITTAYRAAQMQRVG